MLLYIKFRFNQKNEKNILNLYQDVRFNEGLFSIKWFIGSSSTFSSFQELEQVAMDYVRAVQIAQTIGDKTDQDYSLKFKNK